MSGLSHARIGLRLAPLLLATALYGCGGSNGGSEDATNPAGPIDDQTGPVDSAGPAEPVNGTPQAVEGFLLVTRENELLRIAADGSSSEVVTRIGELDFRGAPDVLDGRVYVGSNDNTINAFDLDDGSFLWEATIGAKRFDATVSAVSCISGSCLVAGDNGIVLAVDPLSGNALWTRSLRPDEDVDGDLSTSTPVIVGDRVYITTDDGGFADDVQPGLHVLELATGAVLGSVALVGTGGTPVFADDGTLLVAAGEVLTAFEPSTLDTLWSLRTGPLADPGTEGDIVVAHAIATSGETEESYIAGLDLASGAELWEIDAGTEKNVHTPLIEAGVVYAQLDAPCAILNCSRGSPVALDAASGATIWNDEPLVVEGAPTLAGDRLVYPGVAGSGLGAIDVRDGAVLWNVEGIDFRVGGPVFVTPSGTFRPPWAPSASR